MRVLKFLIYLPIQLITGLALLFAYAGLVCFLWVTVSWEKFNEREDKHVDH